jgi:hypothetical protein
MKNTLKKNLKMKVLQILTYLCAAYIFYGLLRITDYFAYNIKWFFDGTINKVLCSSEVHHIGNEINKYQENIDTLLLRIKKQLIETNKMSYNYLAKDIDSMRNELLSMENYKL